MFRKYLIALAVFVAFNLIMIQPGQAMVITLLSEFNLDKATVDKGITVKSSDGNLRLGIAGAILNKPTKVLIKQFDRSLFEYPENWRAVSDVYEFDILNKNAFQNKKPLSIVVKTLEPSKQLKKIFFWDNNLQKWIEHPSEAADFYTIKLQVRLPYAKLVVLTHKEIIEIGHASWYAYKNCDCAASPDYPKGSLLKVTNLENNKELVVKINDYGPDRSIFPERVIDLDKTAFKKIGSLRKGVLKNIKVSQWR